MRKYYIFILLLAAGSRGHAQQNNQGNAGIDLRKKGFVDNYFVRKADSVDLEKVPGSPYLTREFRLGTIIDEHRRAYDSVLVRFNAYNNEINFIRDGQLFALDNAFEVRYLDVPADSSTLMVFRSGYPSIDNQTPVTYYQLVAGGNKVHLLKLIRKQLQEYTIRGTGIAPRKELVTLYRWYVYTEADGIHEVKSSRASIEKALSSLKASIDKIVSKHDLNLRKDDDMITLIELLDKR